MPEEVSSNALMRGFMILEAVAESRSGLTNSEINRRLKIPKSSASYLLRTMEKRGYLRRDQDTGKYQLGFKLLSLTKNMLTNFDVRELAKPAMRKFVERAELPIQLAVIDNGRAVYIEKLDVPSFVKMDIWVGHRVPVHTTAVGKCLMAFLPAEEIIEILETRGMEKKTLHSISTHTRFLRELEKVRQFGFAIDNEENSEGVRCVAAPIFNAEGNVVAAIGTSGLLVHLNETRLPEITDLIKRAAEDVSEKMGFQTQNLQNL